MKGRTIAIVLLSLFLLGVLGLCGLTTFGAYHWVRASGVTAYQKSNDIISAQVSETHTFPVGENLAIDVNTSIGDISVSAVPGVEEVILEVKKTGWGATEADAKVTAEKLNVELHQEGSQVSAVYQTNEPNGLVFGTYRSPSVSFTIQVPPEIDVTLKTLNGDLSLNGTQGKTLLDSAFGSLTIRDVKGEQTINGANASLDIQGMDAGSEAVSIRISFGELKAEKISAGTVSIENMNGAILLSEVKSAGLLKVNSSFDAIDLNDITSAGLEITSQNGAVSVTRSVIDGAVQVETSFNKIDLAGVQANRYHLDNQNGAIHLDGAQGVLELDTSFDEIVVTDAQEAVLNITNQNGKVSFSGTLRQDADHSIETSFEDVVVTLPADTAVNLEITTSFGNIQSDLPFTTTGEASEDSWSGKLNGGGMLMKIQNQNGSVKIKELK